jgi:hypothetical protein
MGGPNTSPNCYRRTGPFFKYILNDKNIKTDNISFLHDAYFADNLVFTDKLNQIQDKSNIRYVTNALVRTVKMLNAKGKQVVLIYDMPDLRRDIKDCFQIRQIKLKNQLDSSMFVNDFERYRALVDELTKRTAIKVFYTH